MACTALTQTARVVVRPNPFRNEVREYRVGVGRSIASVVRDVEIEGSQGYWHSVSHQGAARPADEWHSWLVGSDELIAVRAVPAGGGDKGKATLRTVAMLAVVIGSAGGAGPLAGWLGWGKVVNGAFVASKVGTALITSGLSALGLWGVNQIIPLPAQDKLQPNDLPIVNKNGLTPYGAIPRLYGQSIIYPRQAGQHWIDHIDEDGTYIRAIYTLGYGRLDIDTSTLKLGDTLLDDIIADDDYEGSEYEVREGYSGDAARTVFPPMLADQTCAIELVDDTYSAPINTAEDTDEIIVSVKFTEGLGCFDPLYLWLGARSDFLYEVRCDATDGWQLVGYGKVIGKSGKVRVKTRRFKLTGVVPADGGGTVDTPQQWEVRIKQTPYAAEVDDRYTLYNDCELSLLRSVSWIDPVNTYESDGLYVSTVGIRVPGEYANLINRLNVEARSYLAHYASGAWQTPALSYGGDDVYNNPAWIYADILRGSANTNPAADADIDPAALATWAANNVTNGFTFNAVFENQETTYQALEAVASIGRGTFWMDDGAYSVLEDKSRSGETPVALITPRNSWGGQGTKTLAEPIHGIRASYVSEANGWIETERAVYRDGYDGDTATNIEALNLWGCTNATLADKLCWYYINCAIQRPETFTKEMDFEHLTFQRGAYVEVSDDTALIGQTPGARVISYTDNGSSLLLTITLDTSTTVAAGTYKIIVREAATGDKLGPFMLNAGLGEQSTWSVLGPVSLADWTPDNDLVTVGLVDEIVQECLVTGIAPASQETASVSFIPYSDAVYDAGTASSYEPTISSRPDQEATPPLTPDIIAIQTDEGALRRLPDGSLDSGIVITLNWPSDVNDEGVPLPHPAVERVGVQWRIYHAEGLMPWQPATAAEGQAATVRVGGLEDGQPYDVRLRAIAASGVATEWVNTSDNSGFENGVEVIGMSTPPPDVEGLSLDAGLLSWSYPIEPIDFAGFRVRWIQTSLDTDTYATWDYATPIHDGIITTNQIIIPPLNTGVTHLLVRAEDIAGNQSDAVMVEATAGDPETENIAYSRRYGNHASANQPWAPILNYNGYIADKDENGNVIPLPEPDSEYYYKFWAFITRGESSEAAHEYYDVHPQYYLDFEVENAVNYHVDYLVHNPGDSFNPQEDDGWVPFAQKSEAIIRYAELYDVYHFAKTIRICVEAQLQSLAIPRIKWGRIRYGYPTLTDSGTLTLWGTAANNTANLTGDATYYCDATTQLTSYSDGTPGQIYRTDINPGGGLGPEFRKTDSASTASYTVLTRGYRAFGGGAS